MREFIDNTYKIKQYLFRGQIYTLYLYVCVCVQFEWNRDAILSVEMTQTLIWEINM